MICNAIVDLPIPGSPPSKYIHHCLSPFGNKRVSSLSASGKNADGFLSPFSNVSPTTPPFFLPFHPRIHTAEINDQNDPHSGHFPNFTALLCPHSLHTYIDSILQNKDISSVCIYSMDATPAEVPSLTYHIT